MKLATNSEPNLSMVKISLNFIKFKSDEKLRLTQDYNNIKKVGVHIY